MRNYTASTFGESIADQYDSLFSHVDPNQIDRLCELSGDGKVFELGIGTGRIALPLLKEVLKYMALTHLLK